MNPSADVAGVTMDTAFWVATLIFLVSYALIISEKTHKTIVALAGASLVLVFKILEQREAFHAEDLGVDWNVIFLHQECPRWQGGTLPHHGDLRRGHRGGERVLGQRDHCAPDRAGNALYRRCIGGRSR